jgi:hypothetical protein
MSRQWETTEAPLVSSRRDPHDDRKVIEYESPAAVPPIGHGWDLRGVVVHGNRVLWFWQRDV